ncbi:MAG TPA: hypothetical protein VGN63_14025 [Flavisolibacter sp.]|jgi:hypothetical protein|nr:hypothetical protein [Flavisolibacter sp.]
MKGKIIIAICLLVAVAGLYGVKEYFRTHDDLAGEAPVANLSASQLITAFETNAAKSRQQYVDKVVRVTGYVTGIAAEDNPVVISLGEKGTMSSVQCSMDSTHPVTAANVVGKQVTVKGVCTGAITGEMFGTDVKLTRCLLETEKP